MSTCTHPITVYRSKQGINPDNGKWPVTTNPSLGYVDKVLKVPCGRCCGCRLERSRVWAIRCMHEAQTHEASEFITLTYDDEHLPKVDKNGFRTRMSLYKKDLQLFFKRLRKQNNGKYRYYACGEYGEKHRRPHYHAIVFGLDLFDRKLYSKSGLHNIYTSEILTKAWNFGNAYTGNVSFESCAYVARYIMKKQLGKESENYYTSIDFRTGEVLEREPEFTTMSLKPGIGAPFVEKYAEDIFSKQGDEEGTVIIRGGIQCNAPSYYEKYLLKKGHATAEYIQQLKKRRRSKIKEMEKEKLNSIEKILNSRVTRYLQRNLPE